MPAAVRFFALALLGLALLPGGCLGATDDRDRVRTGVITIVGEAADGRRHQGRREARSTTSRTAAD